jgi:hypothetical protein
VAAKYSMKASLTIFTDATLTWQDRTALRFSNLLRWLSRKPKAARINGIGGHYAVTRSLIDGLTSLQVAFNYNPVRLDNLAERVLVLTNRRALRRAIRLKADGKIKTLMAGPNLVILPSDDLTICSSEIDLYLVNSEWTQQAYIADSPLLSDRCKIWAAGVNVEYWKPSSPPIIPTHRVLLYEKNAPLSLVDFCLKTCENRGLQVVRMQYGLYSAEEFRAVLQASRLAIFLSQSESQGIALAESWSMNVPTLVWNPGFVVYGGLRLKTSSAPYLCEQTGIFFESADQLEAKMRAMLDRHQTFTPRTWIINHMSDEISARRFCELAGINA